MASMICRITFVRPLHLRIIGVRSYAAPTKQGSLDITLPPRSCVSIVTVVDNPSESGCT